MAVQLPGWLIPAYDEIGLPWPGINEDELRAWAQSVRTFASDMAGSSAGTHQTVAGLAGSSRSSFTTALATRWEQQSQVVAGLQGHLNDFAGVLDGAAEAISTQKQSVIGAVTMLADQINNNQVKPSVTIGLSPAGAGGTARSEQISLARQAVQSALGYLEAVLSGNLNNIAIPQVSEQISASLAGLRNSAVPAAKETGTVRLSYRSLHQAARTIRGKATETENTGTRAYNENAGRILMGSNLGSADDGGYWHAVVQAVEQALGNIADILFKPLSEAISDYQKNTANAVSSFATEVEHADDSRLRGTTGRRASVTQQEARLSGARAASEFADHEISFTVFFELLKEHEHDPAWQTAAMRTLGSTGLWNDIYKNPAFGQNKADMQALARAVAAAMAHGVNFPAPSGVTGTAGEQEVASEALLAPLLRYASFPPRVLLALGREAMQPAYDMYAPEIFSALAKDPNLAAQFVRQNAPRIVSPPFSYSDDRTPLLLAVLKAGTIGPKGTHPRGGAAAVQALVTAYDNDAGVHVPAQSEALYGQIITSYWPDVQYAITSQLQGAPAPDGMTLTAQGWAPFIDEAMRDPATARMLLGVAYEQVSNWQSEAAGGSPPASDAYAYQAGLLQGFFDLRASEAYKSLGSPSSWITALSNYAGYAADIAFDVVIDPGSAAKTIVTDIGRDILDAAVSSFTSRLNRGITAQKPAPSGFQSANVQFAIDYYQTATPEKIAGDPGLAALYNSAKDYGGGSFIAKMSNPSEMTPAQREAFNEWLSSPAVMGYVVGVSDDPNKNYGLGGAFEQGYNVYVVESVVAS